MAMRLGSWGRRGGGRTIARDEEVMNALRKAKAELPEGTPVNDALLSERATQHLAVSAKYFMNFLSKKAGLDNREELGLPAQTRPNRGAG